MVIKKVKKSSGSKKEEVKKTAPKATAGKDEAPKKAPVAAAAASDKQAEKREKPVDPERQAKIDAAIPKAIEDIKAGLKEFKKNHNSYEYVHKEWRHTYKDILGPYKKFLIDHPEHFAVKEDARGAYAVGLLDDPPPSPVIRPGKSGDEAWPQLCQKAWDAYCFQVPTAKRSEMSFVSGFPKAARESLAGLPGGALSKDVGRAKVGDKQGKKPKSKVKKKAKA